MELQLFFIYSSVSGFLRFFMRAFPIAGGLISVAIIGIEVE
jgi:hypothetical protein